MKVICGIDPGLKGGVGLINEGGTFLAAYPMPIDKTTREVDVVELDYLLGVKHSPSLIVVEKVGPVQNSSRKSAFTFGGQYHSVISVVKLLKTTAFIRVAPKTWQADILRDTKKTKQDGLAFCYQRYPGSEEIIQGQDGLSDALCMAEHGRRKHL